MDSPRATFLYWNVVHSLNSIWFISASYFPGVVVRLPLWWCSHLCSSHTGWMPSWADHLQSLSRWSTGQTQSPGPERDRCLDFVRIIRGYISDMKSSWHELTSKLTEPFLFVSKASKRKCAYMLESEKILSDPVVYMKHEAHLLNILDYHCAKYRRDVREKKIKYNHRRLVPSTYIWSNSLDSL